MKKSTLQTLTFLNLLCLSAQPLLGAASPLGVFEDHADIGPVGKPGSAQFDAAKMEYAITGSGENMWFTADALHYAWKQASGDVTIAATVRWIGNGGNAHRKACLIIRQSLDPDSAYADAAWHGDGLTSLQYRETKGAATREIQSNVSGPTRIRIEKEGDFVSMSIAREGEALHAAGGSFKIRFTEPFYIGLGVCAHDNKVLDFNSDRTGTMKLWRKRRDGSQPEQVTFDEFNDWFPHPSPDGKWIVFLSYEKEVKRHPADRDVQLRLIPTGGGEVQVLAKLFGGQGTINAPSWSPDNRNVAFVSYRHTKP